MWRKVWLSGMSVLVCVRVAWDLGGQKKVFQGRKNGTKEVAMCDSECWSSLVCNFCAKRERKQEEKKNKKETADFWSRITLQRGHRVKKRKKEKEKNRIRCDAISQMRGKNRWLENSFEWRCDRTTRSIEGAYQWRDGEGGWGGASVFVFTTCREERGALSITLE